jgi:hypothetical protein
MKNVKLLKGRSEGLLNRVNGVGEESIDSTGEQTSKTDYNFDILRQHYAGTDFEPEANSLCDVLTTFGMKNKGLDSMVPLVVKIKEHIISPEGTPTEGFEPYADFIAKLMEMLEESVMTKASPDVMLPVLNEEKELPNVKGAQAKLIELEQYLEGMNLNARQKWKDYLSEARQKAAVGDDQFNPNPELAQDDMEYMRESSRQKQMRDSAKNSILQGLVGGE